MPVDESAPRRRAWDAAMAWVPQVLAAVGMLWAALSLLDAPRTLGAVAGPALALAGFALDRATRRSRVVAFLALLALAYGLGALSRPEMLRADFGGYYSWLRSAAFDHDLDFTNEMETWGYEEGPTKPIGHHYNHFTVGPALAWSPFFGLAHLYVLIDRELSGERYEADGYSSPYLRSTALGTITGAVAGGWLLVEVLAGLAGTTVAVLAVVAAVAVSPVLYYVFFLPGMSHGLAFGIACAVVWSAARVRAGPSRRGWILLGALLGAAILIRPQAAVLALIPAALAVEQLRRRRVPPVWVAQAAGAALLAVVPQMVAWKLLYGAFFRMPAGAGFPEWAPGRGWFDPWSPRWLDVIVHADHGLFTWTPAMILAVAGLMLALPRWPALAAAGLAVFLATAWLTGARTDWAGSDAFGARRFDVFVPFAAVGFAALLLLCRQRPLLAPTLLLATLAVWNLGMVNIFRSRGVTEAAGLEQVAARQARQLRRTAEAVMGRLAGQRGKAMAYKFFAGEFFYWNLNLAGTIDLGTGDPRYLVGGWSAPENREGPPTFRWAQRQGACVRFPLDRPEQDLRTVIRARAPGRLESQTMAIDLNGAVLKQAALDREWTDVTVVLPVHLLVPGENMLCLRFSAALPEQEGSRAAAVSRIQLP